MKKKNWEKEIKRGIAFLTASSILITMLASSSFAVNSYYSPDGLIGDLAELKEQTWSNEMRDNAEKLGFIPTGLSQQQSAIMGGDTTKFWFQNEKARTAEVVRNGKTYELDFSDFNHRYYSCADSHSTGWFAPVGSQLVFKELYYPTTNVSDYPQFIRDNNTETDTMKFTLLLISLLSSAYDTPSLDELRDSDKTSMYYYLLWLSVWANDMYAANGQFHGISPEDDWDYVQAMVRRGYAGRLNPDVWGSTAVYDAFRDGGPAERYFFNCWKAAGFLASLDFQTEIGASLPVTAPVLGDDGMYHMTFEYSGLSSYEKEVYRRLEADNLQGGWEYVNDGDLIDFKSATGQSGGAAIAVLRLRENSEEDHFNNCGFGMGGLAGFQGCAVGKDGKAKWGNTQIYFSAVAEPLEILVNGTSGGGHEGEWNVHVDRYDHEERWETNYNIQLRKYDSETGQPLAGSKWDVLEAFDAGQLADTELESQDNWANRTGSQFKKWDGWDYGDGNPNGDVANDPCSWDINVTNGDGLLMLGDNDGNASGQAAHTDRKQYAYNKGYCGGHPEPEIELSGDPEIDADLETQAYEAWETEVRKCEALSEAGGFFHSMDEGEGKEKLEADRDQCYREFLSLEYRYSAVELDPRPGYTVHGSHTDDIPVGVKTVTASEYKDFHENRLPAVSVSSAKTFEAGKKGSISLRKTADVKKRKKEETANGKSAEAKDSASPSDASISDATRSDAVRKTLLTRLKELFENPRSLWNQNYAVRSLAAGGDGDGTETEAVEFQNSEVKPVNQGRADLVDHTFIVYDHRTEGEIHINKQDLYLRRDGKGTYNSYGDSQGDGTLEGAVYGLFAMGNIKHPDGHSGIVFEKDNLVAVAATDRNGDASFLAITEAPGSFYDYKTGKIGKKTGGFNGPENLHRDKASADASYPVSNNELLNGNCWIGRPLIVEENGTNYYIKELNRSEGYELSVSGRVNAVTNGRNNYNQEYTSPNAVVGKITMDNSKNANYFEIRAEKTDHDVILKGFDFPKGAVFELSAVKTVPDRIQVPVYTIVQKPAVAAAGTYVFRDDRRVEASVGDAVIFPGGQSYTVQAVSPKKDKTIGVKPMNYHTMGLPAVTDLESKGEAAAFKGLYNGELEDLGYKTPGTDAPWVRVLLQGTTDTEWITAIAKAIKDRDLQYFNRLRITDMEQADGEWYAVMRYEWNLYGDSRDAGVYVPEKDTLYVKKDGGDGYFVYAAYKNPTSNPAVLSAAMSDGFLIRAALKDQKVTGLTVEYPAALPDSFTLITEQTPSYWVYAAGEQRISGAGDFLYTGETEVSYVGQEGVRQVEKTVKLDASYDDEEETYTVHIPADAFETADTVSLKVSDDGNGMYGIKTAYINGSFFACIPPNPAEDSYMVNVLLTKPSGSVPTQDGGTGKNAAEVSDRPIKQKVKIVKDISVDENGSYRDNTFAGSGHGDGVTGIIGERENNAVYLPNFRFKIYQKSNLERLFRAWDGTVVWQDRNGNTVDISAYRKGFPEKAQKLYTQVPHETNPLIRDTNAAATANKNLYSFTDGLINLDQNPGYTRILETTAQTEAGYADYSEDRYDYEKFFDAVKTANSDKWDTPDHSAAVSDHVRQFAITWYLDDEVEKLVRPNQAGETEGAGGGEQRQNEIYGTALSAALKKTENYLRPFFAYDLDEIYAIEWDSETDGGKDRDRTTLSADLEDAEAQYCCGVSEYLPYGTYVAVEQQPFDRKLGDLYNKHYKTDVPKEIVLPEILSSEYNYSSGETAENLASRYFIRFNEEWPGDSGDDLRKYVIQAHGCQGDYEIYKYGLDLDRLSGAAAGDPSGEGHFTVTQSVMDPMKDYYNTIVDSAEEGGNPESHYLADDRNKGVKTPNGTEYEADAIERIYHYGSVSEHKQAYPNRGTVMEGMQVAYDGRYASMLVPWTVTEAADELSGIALEDSGGAEYQGYAFGRYRNTFYTGKLRIEKLDSETGENILHDGAVFTLYAAEREDGRDTDGLVKFYSQKTAVKGSRQFLEAMGAVQIRPAARALLDAGNLCTGYVPAGTPVCSEAEQIILTDRKGRRTGEFEAFTTTRDGLQADEEDMTQISYQDQNSGYLVTPQPLGAGTYVLCEVIPPAGYVRTKPVAVEIYSDKVSYYADGNKDDRVTAAVYGDEAGEAGETERGILDTAGISVGNMPVRLEVSKVKDKDQTVTYRTDTRLEGSLLELIAGYGKENLEFAYKNGNYLGYAWYKGTLEYLESRKSAGEQAEAVWIDGVFAGYGLISRTLDTADDASRYTAGAEMVLYDAIEIRQNGDSGDYGYDGVEISRDRNSNVQSVKVREGYAGESVEFINRDNPEGSLAGETGEGTWTYEAVPRKDTDILFYSLSDLKVTETGSDGRIYGRDREGRRVLVRNRSSVYAMKNGHPLFEITGGNLERIQYSALDNCFSSVNPETVIYHLDRDGNRDAMVEPETGMACVTEKTVGPDGREAQKILVWPVNTARTANGAVIARDKIRTYRIATVNSDTEQEYTIGTCDGQRLNQDMNPVVDRHGLPVYYQKSGGVYKKGDPIYDIDGDYVRYKYDDLLPAYNRDAYRINGKTGMEEIGEEEAVTDDGKLWHRQGEAWIMENTWITGEKYPNDPFQNEMTVGQADMLKRVIPGTYIMEELNPPDGCVKGLPVGITVGEMDKVQSAEMVDRKIGVEIVKTDAADEYKLNVASDYQDGLSVTEPKGAYSYGQIAGAHLALYKAKRIGTADTEKYPRGYFLEKTEKRPAEWTVENTADNQPLTVSADWITDGAPKYFGGIPAGDYILEESEAAGGYIRRSMELEVKADGEVQTVNLKNDHTKLEVYKYCRNDTGNRIPLPNAQAAGLALYGAATDEYGDIIAVEGILQYDGTKLVEEWITDDLAEFTEGNVSFLTAFEEGFQSGGSGFVWLTWETKGGRCSADRISVSQTAQGEGMVELWKTNTGKTLRITIYRDLKNGSFDAAGNLPWKFEYQFNYRELAGGVKSYDTLEGMHRIDYLAFNAVKDGGRVGNYVLVETKVPDGYGKADPKAVILTEKGDVQRYSLENSEKYLDILKVMADGTEEYAVRGVQLTLRRADGNGNFTDAQSNLTESWVSGEDGVYTEQDRFSGKIPTGFAVGDLKPHRINRLPDGVYYVAESEVLPYMMKGNPVRVEAGSGTAAIVRIRNIPVQGRLEILKTGADTGEGLLNARFLVTNRDTEESWYVTTGSDGLAWLTGLPVGTVQADGTVSPYTYAIEEISAPELYRISGGKKFFRFDGADSDPVVSYLHKVEDQPCEIRFKKTNFDTGMAVEGAKLAVYHTTAVDGEYQKIGKAIETVISGPDGFTMTKKLSAGQTYRMEELEAPAGMQLSAPVIFTVNRMGDGIDNIYNGFSVLQLKGADGAVESLTVIGRMANKVSVVLKDLETGEELPDIIGSTDRILTAGDGLKNGHLYEITEYTGYSDGKQEMSGRETKRLRPDGNGNYTLKLRTYVKTRIGLTDQDGRILDTWETDGRQRIHTVENPLTAEKITAVVSGNVGRGHTAVKTGGVIKYSISWENPCDVPVDVTVKASLAEGLEFLRADGQPAESKGTLTWVIQDAEPNSAGSLELAAVITGQPGGKAEAVFQTKAGKLEYRTVLQNPIVMDGSMTLRNHISGLGKNPEDSFTYRLRFLDQAGNLLTGYQGYTGSSEGRIRGEGIISLKSEESVTFNGLPCETRYEIVPEASEGYVQKGEKETGTVGKKITSAVFESIRADGTRREILTAGGSYRLTETTVYSDGEEKTSGICRFTVSWSGRLDNADMEDKPAKYYFSKTDIDTGEEIAGGHYSVTDAETGGIIWECDKEEEKPVEIPAELLKPGKEYWLREVLPPSGYAFEEKIRFRVNGNGGPETVVMQDKKTGVFLEKIDADTGETLTGGHYKVRDPDTGETVFAFTAEGERVSVRGLLTAGRTYEFMEETPPDGYAYSRAVEFTVPEEPGDITVTMKDRRTEILVKKLTGVPDAASLSDAGTQLPGFCLQILNKDMTPAKAVRDSGGIKAGEKLVFTTTKEFTVISGQLTAGADYRLHEIKPGDGYSFAEDVPFTVALEEGREIVVMNDKPTHTVISKKALTGSEELPGNHMTVTDENGKIAGEWISEDKPHEIIGRLIAGKTYFLCETTPKKGYACSEKVPFTVSLDGRIDQVEMRNEETRVRIRKVDAGGRQLQGAILQILDTDGQVVIPDFASSETPVLISGRLEAGKLYNLHEVKAPSGYLLSGDVPFAVPEGAVEAEVTMVDPRRENPEPENRKMRLMKTDAETGKPLSGFTFTIFTADGEELASAVTGENGYAVFDMPVDGEYRFREIAGMEGYILSDMEYALTVRHGKVAEGSTVAVANRRIPAREMKIGKITAEYRPKPGYRVKLVSGDRIRGRKTGDATPYGILLAVFTAGIAGYFVLRRKKKGEM